jgi:hypothetical protein
MRIQQAKAAVQLLAVITRQLGADATRMNSTDSHLINN